MPLEKTTDVIHLGFTVSTRAQMHTLGKAISSICMSYPKSGRTWLRFMVGQYLEGEPDPKLHMAFIHDGADGVACDFDQDWYDSYPIMVLVRDPRDVVVSHYFQITRRDRSFGHARPPELQRGYPIAEFIRRRDFGVDRIIAFYNKWFLPNRALLVSYEQMMSNAEDVLTRVLQFLRIAVEGHRITAAVAATTFERLQRRERDCPTRSELLRPGDPNDPLSFKVRRGEVGGHRHHLSNADLEFLNRRLDEALQPGILRSWYCASA